jgi:hypothetical protein
VGGTTSGIPFILIRILMDTKPQKYYANVISPSNCWVKYLSYYICEDVFSLPPIPHFTINESQEGVIE